MSQTPVSVTEVPRINRPDGIDLSSFSPDNFVFPISGTTSADYPSHEVIIALPCKEITVQQGKERDLLLLGNAITTWVDWALEICCQKCPNQGDCFKNFFISSPG